MDEREKFYVVFIDFTKAFDYIDRELIQEKLEETLGINNVWTKTAKSILRWNEVNVSDNRSTSEPILQTNGVLQGDPLSPLLFILAAEEILRLTQREGINAYAYADDIVVGSKDITKLQETMDVVEEWCTKHKFEINVKKTQMMIFRNSGRTPEAAEIFIQNKKLKTVPDYKYLGMTL